MAGVTATAATAVIAASLTILFFILSLPFFFLGGVIAFRSILRKAELFYCANNYFFQKFLSNEQKHASGPNASSGIDKRGRTMYNDHGQDRPEQSKGK